jgi:hypothetical protein
VIPKKYFSRSKKISNIFYCLKCFSNKNWQLLPFFLTFESGCGNVVDVFAIPTFKNKKVNIFSQKLLLTA